MGAALVSAPASASFKPRCVKLLCAPAVGAVRCHPPARPRFELGGQPKGRAALLVYVLHAQRQGAHDPGRVEAASPFFPSIQVSPDTAHKGSVRVYPGADTYERSLVAPPIST